MTARRLPPELVALTPGDFDTSPRDEFLGRVRAAVAAGLTGILVREPSLSDRALLELCSALRELLGDAGWLGVHDRAHLARAARADGVHLGFRSLAPRDARASTGAQVAIGFSAHAGDARAAWDGADYLYFGPVLDTPSKRGWKEPLGFEALARAIASADVPAYAIGGLAPEHASAVHASGARGMAVLAGVFQAIDPARAVERYVAAWRAASRVA